MVDVALGVLLGVSSFLLALALVSQRRSGLLSLLLVSVGLSVHIAFTVTILAMGHYSEMLSDIDGYLLLALDFLVLLAALLIGLVGGKAIAGPS
ncbi:TPA: hypothetical protein HA259_05105 [Thermoplasmata archaeon]|nr:hypothetical protein [Thermoplasmata archaeon]